MYAPIDQKAQPLEEILREIEPRRLSGTEAVGAAESVARIEKLCAAAKARFARRAEECGEPGIDRWLARKSGVSRGKAKKALETAKQVEDLPATKEAFTNGELSEDQAAEVASAATADPSAELELLDIAKTQDLQALRDKARRVRLSAEDPEDLHARQHKAREFRGWTGDDGMVKLYASLSPEVGVPTLNRIEAETDRIFRQAYKEGRREPREAYAADAFVALMNGKGEGKGTKADLVVVVDWEAFVRGHTHEGERCHIPGVGPVPVSVARRIEKDAFLKAVVVDGTDIAKVRHFGRYIPAEVRTALSLGQPPDLDGAVCADQACGRRHGLENDHRDPFAKVGVTEFENIDPRCPPDHREKTERDRQAGLFGPDPPRAPLPTGGG